MLDFKFITLQPKIPVFNVSWRFWLWIVKNKLNSFASLKQLSNKYRWSCSIARTIAGASLSVWEYYLSTSMRAQLAYATTHLSFIPGAFSLKMADIPEGKASVTYLVSLFGSKYAITSVLVSRFFIVWKDLSCSLPHKNGWSFFVYFCNGSETSLKFGINLAQYVAIPRKLLTTCVVVGRKAF